MGGLLAGVSLLIGPAGCIDLQRTPVAPSDAEDIAPTPEVVGTEVAVELPSPDVSDGDGGGADVPVEVVDIPCEPSCAEPSDCMTFICNPSTGMCDEVPINEGGACALGGAMSGTCQSGRCAACTVDSDCAESCQRCDSELLACVLKDPWPEGCCLATQECDPCEVCNIGMNTCEPTACCDDADCDDEDPCTTNTCTDGMCKSFPDASCGFACDSNALTPLVDVFSAEPGVWVKVSGVLGFGAIMSTPVAGGCANPEASPPQFAYDGGSVVFTSSPEAWQCIKDCGEVTCMEPFAGREYWIAGEVGDAGDFAGPNAEIVAGDDWCIATTVKGLAGSYTGTLTAILAGEASKEFAFDLELSASGSVLKGALDWKASGPPYTVELDVSPQPAAGLANFAFKFLSAETAGLVGTITIPVTSAKNLLTGQTAQDGPWSGSLVLSAESEPVPLPIPSGPQ